LIDQKYNQIKKELTSFRAELLAVSKGHSVSKIKEAYDLGQRAFGENYLQEFIDKKNELNYLDISWHFIGRLQSKKIKNIVGECDLIHSVGELKHLEEINKRAGSKKVIQNILLQVNLVEEGSKAGFKIDEAEVILKENWDHIQINGFMFMPPAYKEKSKYEEFYNGAVAWVKTMSSSFEGRKIDLSMGTSMDYQVALEFGATWIRLGRTLFGERPA